MQPIRLPRFGDLRIRNQINLIVCVAAALLVLTMGAVYVAFDALMTRQAVDRFNDLATQGGGSLRDTLRGIDANARTYAHILEIAGYPDFMGLDTETETYLANAYAAIHNLSDDMKGVALVPASGVPSVAGADAEAEAAHADLVGQPAFLTGQPARAAFLGISGQDAAGWPYFAHAAPILAKDGKGRPAGWLVTLFGSGSIRTILDTLTNGDARMTGMLVVDGGIRLATSTMTEAEQAFLAGSLGAVDGVGISNPQAHTVSDIRFRRAPSLLLRADVPDTGWRLGVVVPRAVIKAPILSLAWIGFAILAAGAGILAAASIATIRAITRPVEAMAADMAEIGTPGTARALTVSVHNEVGMMATHINGLIRRLEEADRRAHETERRLDQAELARVRSELSYYQSQINPHFLYNTLESIRSMALVYEAEEIAQMAVATATIFRYAVRNEAMTDLGEEIACVREYVTVMQLRFPGRYGLSVRVEDGLERRSVPRMLLQPLVENAFRHGFAHRKGSGRLHIAASRCDDGWQVMVCDNGTGIAPSALDAVRRRLAGDTDDGVASGSRVGLINIHRRLQLGSGGRYGLSIDSREGCWTRVTLHLPGDGGPLSDRKEPMI